MIVYLMIVSLNLIYFVRFFVFIILLLFYLIRVSYAFRIEGRAVCNEMPLLPCPEGVVGQ
jgi:hypothetical protein